MDNEQRKSEILTRIQVEHDHLVAILAGLAPQEMVEPGVMRQWSVKDILAHLTAWEQHFLAWVAAGLRGETPQPPLARAEMDAFNQQVYLANRDRPLEEVLAGFHSSYRQTLETVQAIPAGDWFTPRRFAWTGRYRLYAFITGNTYHHYTWAQTQLHAWLAKKRKRQDKPFSR